MRLTTLLDGLTFPEAPRWRDGNLLVTTMTCNQLVKVSPTATILKITQLPSHVWACAVGENGDIFLCTSAHAIPDDCMRHRSGRVQPLNDE